jgi:hypothetical protein
MMSKSICKKCGPISNDDLTILEKCKKCRSNTYFLNDSAIKIIAEKDSLIIDLEYRLSDKEKDIKYRDAVIRQLQDDLRARNYGNFRK